LFVVTKDGHKSAARQANNVSFDEANINLHSFSVQKMHVNLPVSTENGESNDISRNANGGANVNANYSFIEPMEDKSAANFEDMYSRDLDRIEYTTIYDENNLGRLASALWGLNVHWKAVDQSRLFSDFEVAFIFQLNPRTGKFCE
jgi:hypothetical protein